jgi:hypothetical protein
MGKVKEQQFEDKRRAQINKAAETYLCDQDEGDNCDAYAVLLEESDKGNGDCRAADFISVWEPLVNSVSVDEMIHLIEDGISEPEVPEVLKKIDWTDLRGQKSVLLKLIDVIENTKPQPVKFEGSDMVAILVPKDATDALDGILNLIDALQDYAVDEMGVNGIHVFDFEEEENREAETFNEKFARESAESIFDELCESDGFHQEDDMSVEFIAGVMSDRYEADIIKAKLRQQILTDLKENSREFLYDDTKRPMYDANIREDYEGMVTAYIREVFKKK